ncbi:hypothetical protein D3C76_1605020 [compost metagenome]
MSFKEVLTAGAFPISFVVPRVLPVVLLVVLLSRIKRGCRENRGYDRFVEATALCKFKFGLLRLFTLLFIMIKNSGPV